MRRPLLALTFLVALPVYAQGLGEAPLDHTEGGLSWSALGQRLTMPVPDWSEGAASLADIDANTTARFSEEDGQASLELYRAGQNEKFWTTLYGARLSARPDMSLAEFRATVINVYAQGCQPDTVALFQLEQDDGDVLPPLGYICGAYADDIIDFVGQGEVMVMGFYRSDAGIGMVYQEWRAPSFDTNSTQSWPVSPQEIEARMDMLKQQVTLMRAD